MFFPQIIRTIACFKSERIDFAMAGRERDTLQSHDNRLPSLTSCLLDYHHSISWWWSTFWQAASRTTIVQSRDGGVPSLTSCLSDYHPVQRWTLVGHCVSWLRLMVLIWLTPINTSLTPFKLDWLSIVVFVPDPIVYWTQAIVYWTHAIVLLV